MDEDQLGEDQVQADQEDQKPKAQQPSLGQRVKDAEAIAEAVGEEGANVVKDIEAAGAVIREGAEPAKKAAKGLGIACIVELLLGALAVLFIINLFHPTAAPGATLDSNYAQSGTLSAKVPPNFATLFKEAAAKFDVNPAVIAGIYLTEHHTDSFGKDIPSLDAREVGCSSNSSGARGPMQIIDGTWSGVQSKLIAAGLRSPDRCKYRDAIWGGAAVIRGKMFGQRDASTACNVQRANDKPQYTDDCIRKIGRAYCGACTGPACGTHGYNYCDQTLRHYKIAAGSLAYLPPLLINDPEERKCLALNVK